MSELISPDYTDSRIRQRVFVAALDLLTSHPDFPADWVGIVAKTSGCRTEQVTRYFPRIEDVVFALYARLAQELERTIPDLPEGTVAERFLVTLRTKLALVHPYYRPLKTVLRRLLHPHDELGVTSNQTEIIRTQVQAAFSAVVSNATDAPDTEEETARLARFLYSAHLALLLIAVTSNYSEGAIDSSLSSFVALIEKGGQSGWHKVFSGSIKLLDTIAKPLIDPVPDTTATETAVAILQIVFRHRRLLPESGDCYQEPCTRCFALHLPMVRRYVLRGEPVHFLLPAFPAKSPSTKKVFGTLPDRAELVALDYLLDICSAIKTVYPPGARITICSDGSVFSDLVGVRPEDVLAYGASIQALLSDRYSPSLDHFALDDLFGHGDFSTMQADLTRFYAEPLDALSTRIHSQPRHQAMFNGIHRFLIEEYPDPGGTLSKNRIRELCKPLTLQVIQRSEAWGRLIGDCFPGAVRLSIHPQIPHSEKIGIRLCEGGDLWITPWHGVAVMHPEGTFSFMKRSEAEALDGVVLIRNVAGDPDYFRWDRTK